VRNLKSRLILMVTLLTGVLFLFYAASHGQTPAGAYNSPSLGGGSTSPGGSNTQIQYNNAGAFGGVGGFTFNSGTGSILFTPPVSGGNFQINSNGGNTNTFEVLDAGNGRAVILVDAGSGADTVTVGNNVGVGGIKTNTFLTSNNCGVSSASPAACGSAAAGLVAVPVAATTYTVNTTNATANSEIFIVQDTSTAAGTRLSVTCNTTANTPLLTAKVGATSFTFSLTAPVTNPACFSYFIVN
jgi:hypothetical protein